MDIDIKTVPYEQMRYETVGDWHFDKHGNLHIIVAKMPDVRFEQLVAYHELTEALLCRQRGVAQEAVDKFDGLFEAERKVGKHGEADEPGDDPRAPYHKEHIFATAAEHAMAAEMKVDWDAYEKAILALGR